MTQEQSLCNLLIVADSKSHSSTLGNGFSTMWWIDTPPLSGKEWNITFLTVDKPWHFTAYAPWRPVQSTRAKSNILAGITYKRLRNQVVKTIVKAKTDYVRNEISKNMNNPKKLWKTLKRIAPTKSAPSNFSFIEAEDKSFCDPTEMANKTQIRLSQ